MIKRSICLILLLGGSSVAQSLQERLAKALDPLARPGGTVLAARLMLLNCDLVELSGQVIGKTVNEPSGLPQIDSYEQFTDDKDLNFNIKLDDLSKSKLKGLLGIDVKEVECESVAFARAFTLMGKPELPMFPGWRDEKWNVTFNGKPFWTKRGEAQDLWNSLRKEPKVTVLGVLVIDCGNDCQENKGVTKDCLLDNNSKVELHPVYEIRIID